MAPELLARDNDDNDIDGDEIEGSTDVDLQALSARIALPDSLASLDIVLANDLSIQTQSIERAIKTLKQLIIPRKCVQFAPEILDSSSASSASSSPPSASSKVRTPKVKSQRNQNRLDPYAANVRRSNRIAGRRQSHLIST